jgi:hypothetical protein
MRFLFAAYCMVNNPNGDSLIGVYKRCVRIGLELHSRGHAVAIVCSGYGAFCDATVTLALVKLKFIDTPPRVAFHASSQYQRRWLRKTVREFGADVVVIGEAPMGGVLLDAAVVAGELGIPSVILDNAYSPFLAEKFVREHGPAVDGLALMGPSSFQLKDPPDYYCGVAPLISLGDDAAAALDETWPRARRVVTVLGYEKKAERLAIALLRAVPWLSCELLLITPDAAAAEERLANLPPAIRAKIHVMAMPAESVLFEAMRRSRLVIGKAGFMQTCESICLETPFLGLYYFGCYSVWQLPRPTLRFVGQTSGTAATFFVVMRFLRLLHTPKSSMRAVHSGGFNGLATVCDFLERMCGKLRDGVTAESARLGYTAEIVRQALEARHPGRSIEVVWVRMAPMSGGPDEQVDCVFARYRSGRRESVATLTGRITKPTAAIDQATQHTTPAAGTETARRVWYRSPDGTLTLEAEMDDELRAGHFLSGWAV